MPPKSKDLSQNKGERIAKRIASAGVCSRRAAEDLIAQGLVKVNGVAITTPATLVVDTDKVTVRGRDIGTPAKLRVFLFHKPTGLVTTARDEQGRPTVFDGLPPELPRLISVGRLDLNSEGLLILTTSGELSRYLELPARGFIRTYRVRVFGTISERMIDRLAQGPYVDGVQYGPIMVEFEKKKGDAQNQWVRVSLSEGKNREIRKVFASAGLQVSRLIRLNYGPFELGAIPRGALTEVPMGFLKKHLADFFKSQNK